MTKTIIVSKNSVVATCVGTHHIYHYLCQVISQYLLLIT